MNGQPAAPHDLDDAAFRARLAPLADEVLPPTSPAAPRLPDASRGKSIAPLLAVAGMSAAAVVAAVWFFPWTPNRRPDIVRPGTARVEEPRPALAAPAHPPAHPPAVPSALPPGRLAPVAPAPPAPEVAGPDPAGDMVALLLRRGDAAASAGDIAAARLLFERAVTLGSAAAATAIGKTYDIAFLLEAGARGIAADHVAAATWYRKGAAMGDVDARDRLAKLEASARR